MTKTQNSIGFGFDPHESQHHFVVMIPKSPQQKVRIYERFEWQEDLVETHPQPLPGGGAGETHPQPLPGGGVGETHPQPLPGGGVGETHSRPLPGGGAGETHPQPLPGGGAGETHLRPLPGGEAKDENILPRIDARFDRLKVEMSASKWKMIQEALQKEFNQRLKQSGYKVSKFKQGANMVQRLLGKEMVLLAWAIEDSDPQVIPDAIKNWLGLKPEERWWLYTMTNASTGEAHLKYGWRKAVRFALCENPVEEKYRQTNLFDQYIKDQLGEYE